MAITHLDTVASAVDGTTQKNIRTEAYVLEKANDPFRLQVIVLDEVRGNELLIEMKYSGICHTDLIVQSGAIPALEFPAILGHEGAGYIRAIGSNVTRTDLTLGDFVLLSFNTCGACKQCKRGHPAYCLNGAKLHMGAVRPEDGSSHARLAKDGRSVRSQFFGQSTFSRMTIVQESTVAMKYPYDPEGAAMFAACGCEFQTEAGTVLNVLKPREDDSVVVFGLGGVGLTAVMAAKFLGVGRIIGVDISGERLRVATELGATEVVDSKGMPDVVKVIWGRTGGGGADFCIDCVGNTAIIESMIECLAKCGTAASVGVMPPGKTVSLDPQKHLFDNKRYIGVLEGDSNPIKFIPELVAMQRSGKFPLKKLCTTYPWQDMEQALTDMHAGKVIKPVLQWC
ncbi:hypothetical protein B0A55_11021 [Friedmanniomyces simplex]|uniref:Enoyl reductase (ER) domain-containing protein n=1 Tax=Friedmanniomyces simplex TaxID=329884 RepID=A0A4U0WE48_9PEZI|nr:hypothetical protein B0A55_11021 [Friedmanniomyces simplex]